MNSCSLLATVSTHEFIRRNSVTAYTFDDTLSPQLPDKKRELCKHNSN